MENKQTKKNIRIESGIPNDEMFWILDGITTGGESDVGNILNDSDKELVNDKSISKTVDDTHNIPVPEANVNVAADLREPH